MKIFNKTAIALALVLGASSSVYASPMQLDLSSFGGNQHDAGRFIGTADANSSTATFTEFGFSQMLATSAYDMTDGSLLGSFYDTNIPAELAALGVPTSGIAMDGVTTVNLASPLCAAGGGQCDIDALSPIVPPLASDNEGFLQTWDLQVAYHFDGTLTAAGPSYTGGTFEVFFNSFLDDNLDALAFSGTLTGSTLSAANLDLFFDITFAADNFLNIWNGSSWVDAHDAIAAGDVPTLALDTNVNPPIPTLDQLLLVGDSAIRQTTLDGSVTANIPEPASIALFGLGLLGFGAASRKRKAAQA
ncbi:PEP-CTERM sorting domain-containing protein [Neptunomonas antarctica]|uniref:PEP-CTERM protein-sorting domain-containing protein n=1 Tax=Neptunomonas antarctica TaxID=619304 RepID=A0A1N7JEW1_9GAMM|nr:PEP-CTERM sorting domain-containing protein [Neptunomonas antarctica]SIS47893.1 PEP-CTERM protein-sorting domain-containing protein [Neptunomonas antarctica]